MHSSQSPRGRRRTITCLVAAVLIARSAGNLPAANLEAVRVAADGSGFILEPSGRPFTPWGVNYDRDERMRLLEDYWNDEWSTVETDFREIKDLGANVVRIHLQFGKFMKSAAEPNAEALDKLRELLDLAETSGLYLDITGLGCYHKRDVPAWYDALDETQRWEAQATFWESVAKTSANSTAVFCYDLMNEPVVAAGGGKRTDWLGPALGDKHFVQFITLELGDRRRPDVARAWIERLVAAIRKHDRTRLITVGLVDWSLNKPGLTSGFVPQEACAALDFVAVHIYPKSGKIDDALETLRGFDIGKPIVIEEMFPLGCTIEELGDFIDRSRPIADGWISFYWGKRPEEYGDDTIAAAVTKQWLERFRAMSRDVAR